MVESQSFNRRSFIRKMSALGALCAFNSYTNKIEASSRREVKITILHTNDVHSRIEPFPMDGSKVQGLGGVARRSTLIQKIRQEEKNVLLLDAGDMFQGTPYFNLFEGKVELALMSKLQYDAGTFGNHEFDNGISGILKHFDSANFPFITSNYDFSNTALAGKTKEHITFVKDGIKIGLFGLGVNTEGLVDPNNYVGMRYLDPLEVATRLTHKLKNELKCDLVICLSHLGYAYQDDTISDLKLAASTKDIDLIVGGHTHTFLDKPTEIKNMDGKITLVNQAGFGGANLGRIDFIFNPATKSKRTVFNNYTISSEMDRQIVA
ncbi:bifunctional metallophosphatase/5'-nucleotidase [Sphingobacterium pedocola]|uniref:Metallophosphatase n=1 Tax=Sphingobacterium pedocola TaxID=2082722 RepID=A0ABR9T6R6_9SPHI|nr:metallophosphoesterase [Sphingobacterium pedocola]MBE8721025.1 metallophosphatase [Sphingobacterium pedocola]